MTLEAKHISLSRGGRVLFRDFNLRLVPGELLQIVGPNGVGKTSLLNVLTGLFRPEQGDVYWQGESLRQVRPEYHQAMFYLSHQLGVKEELTVLENLRFVFRPEKPGLNQVIPILSRLKLTDYMNTLAKSLSRGQCQRVALARLLLTQAPLWILDEPFSALDTVGMQVIEDCLAEKQRQGGLVLFTSHRMLQTELSLTTMTLEGLCGK